MSGAHMNIPAKIQIRNTAHGTGHAGLAFYTYEDIDGLGVYMEARREKHGQAFVEKWWGAMLPEQHFDTFEALRAAANALTPDQVAAERARYPVIRKLEPVFTDSISKCRLCWMPMSERKPSVLHAMIALNWSPRSDRFAGLCWDHKHMVDDPKALIAALDAEVAQRMASAAAKREAGHGAA